MLLLRRSSRARLYGTLTSGLDDALDDYLASWPPGEAGRFAASLRRFAEEGPF